MDNAPKNRPTDDLNNPREPEIDQQNEIDDMNDLGADARTVGEGRHGMESDVVGESGLDYEQGGIGSGSIPEADDEDLVKRQKQVKFVGEETTTNE